MKRISLLLAMFFLGASLCFAAVTFVTVDWSNSQAGNTGSISCGTYNWATSHFLVCDFSEPAVRIASGTDGALLGSTLNITGLNLSLGVFAICATSDGVIYGGTDIKSDGVTAGYSLIQWANEGATPTQQDPTEIAGAMQFPRTMDAVGTGADTIIGVAGAGSGPYNVSILTTTDGTNFAVTDMTVDSAIPNEMIKQGVALVANNPDRVYGVKADGAGEVVRVDKVGGVWAAAPGFTPPSNYGTPLGDPAGLGAACLIGFAPSHNAIIVLGNSDASDDYITALDGDTGAILLQVLSGVDVATYGYGAFDLDETSGVGYFIARSTTANSHACGKISFDIYVEPVPPLGVDFNNWGLYE